MMGKSDWDAAAAEFVERERKRRGDLTPEQLAAYERGELSEEEAARVQALLVVYPEWTAEPEHDPLSDAEMARDWESVKARLVGETVDAPRRTTAFPSLLAVAAALLAVSFVALLQSRSTIARLSKERSEPRVHGQRHELLPLGDRGGGSGQRAYPLTGSEENFLLVPTLVNHPRFPDYRLEIVALDSEPPKTIWKAAGLMRDPDRETFEISVPRTFLAPGVYRLDLYGLDRGKSALLARYLLRVPAERE